MSNSILRHLCAILDSGSILAASRSLYISQPSLSQYVRRLEAEYGILIFDRSSSPWKLTPEGEYLIEAQKRIDAIDRECRQFFADRRELRTGDVLIGSTGYRTATLLRSVLSDFKRDFPGITVRIVEETTQQVAELVRSGQVDCGFVISSMAQDLERIPVFSERVLIGVPPGLQVKSHAPELEGDYPRIELSSLSGTPFIVMGSGQKFRDYFQTLCTDFALDLPIVLEANSILTVPSFIASGLGAALIPDTISESCRQLGVRLFSIGSVLPINEVSIVWDAARYQSRACKAFIDSTVRALTGKAGVKDGI